MLGLPLGLLLQFRGRQGICISVELQNLECSFHIGVNEAIHGVCLNKVLAKCSPVRVLEVHVIQCNKMPDAWVPFDPIQDLVGSGSEAVDRR